MEPIIREVQVKSVLTKSNLPVSDYSVNPYVGCTHACRYCYASFMKRFTGHPEPWGTFLDVKHWPEIRRPVVEFFLRFICLMIHAHVNHLMFILCHIDTKVKCFVLTH